jgi:hypothetical protein
MFWTIVLSIIIAGIAALAIRSVWKSHKRGGCDACGDSATCPSCNSSDSACSAAALADKIEKQGRG